MSEIPFFTLEDHHNIFISAEGLATPSMEVLYRGASFELSELKKRSSRDWGFWLLESCQTYNISAALNVWRVAKRHNISAALNVWELVIG